MKWPFQGGAGRPKANSEAVSRPSLRLADYVSPRRVVRIEGSPSVDDLLMRLLDGVAAEYSGVPKDAVCREMLDREKVFPTAIGRGVAIPHGTCEALRGPLVSIAQVPDGMEFAAPDKKPVTLVFLLLSPPGDPQQHRLLLADIARLCANADLLERIKSASIPDELMTLLAPGAKSGAGE